MKMRSLKVWMSLLIVALSIFGVSCAHLERPEPPKDITATQKRLHEIRIKKIDFTGAETVSVTNFLMEESRRQSANGVGIKIIWKEKPQTKIGFRLTNILLIDAIEVVAHLTQMPYFVEPDTVVFGPRMTHGKTATRYYPMLPKQFHYDFWDPEWESELNLWKQPKFAYRSYTVLRPSYRRARISVTVIPSQSGFFLNSTNEGLAAYEREKFGFFPGNLPPMDQEFSDRYPDYEIMWSPPKMKPPPKSVIKRLEKDFFKLLRDDKASGLMRGYAALALTTIGVTEHEDEVVALLTSEECDARAYAVKTLGLWKEERHTHKIISTLADKDALVRIATLQALTNIRAGECAPQIAEMLKDTSPSVRASAMASLLALENRDYLAQIATLLKDGNAGVRCTALSVLGDFGAKEFVKSMEPLVNDPDPQVVRYAREALNKLR